MKYYNPSSFALLDEKLFTDAHESRTKAERTKENNDAAKAFYERLEALKQRNKETRE